MPRRKNLEAERARLGLTREQLSAELGITSKTYRKYAAGGVMPSDVLERLVRLTGMSMEYLLLVS